MRQANRIRAAPGHERELNDPVEFLMPGIIRFPIAVKGKGLAGRFIDAQNVRAEVFVFNVEVGVDFKDGPQAILVVAGGFAALDLVVGNRRLAELGVIGIPQVDVDIHARFDALQVLHLRDILHMRLALGGVEIRGGERQVDVVNRHKLGLRATVLRVPHKLEVLPAAKRKLRAQLLQFAAELGHLLRGLPVHERRLAFSLGHLFLVGFAVNFTLNRPVRRKDFFHEARREIDAGFDEHRVNDFVRPAELGTAGRIVAQAGAPQPFLVQFVPLLAGFLVALDLLEQVGDDVL